ncbi:MAG: hypothetical protein JW884_12800 [Deltaproteobacteria bacterium]|nr:hypothetical protein [Deltaproteobacteria bacterium]
MSKKDGFIEKEFGSLGLLQGWKAIGRYLGRSARTARRWKDRGLIIHYSMTGRPFVFIAELNMFMQILGELVEENRDHEGLRKHAAMMRSCKARKRTKEASGVVSSEY